MQRTPEPGNNSTYLEQFVGAEHQQRFLGAWSQFSQSRQRDGEWVSTIYLLTVSGDMWNRLSSQVDLEHGSIYWERIDRMIWSTGEQVIIQMANQCFNGGAKPDWSSIWYTISGPWFDAILRAMEIRRYGPKVIDWEALQDALPQRPDPAP